MLTQHTLQTNHTQNARIFAASLILMCLFTSDAVFAQQVAGRLGTFYAQAVLILTWLFGLGALFGVGKTILAFFSKSPGAWATLGMTIVGILVWYGFNSVLQDLETAGGGSIVTFTPR